LYSVYNATARSRQQGADSKEQVERKEPMVQKKMDVVAVGTLAVDYYALVPSIPAADQKMMVEGYEVHPGGVAGNVMTQIARLGAEAGWFGKIGDDESGKIILEDFKREGIDTSHTEVVGGKHSMFTWIQVNRHGERSITMFPNVLVELTPEDVEEKHGDYIRSSRLIHTEACLLPLKPVLRAMEIAKAAGVTVVFDLDVCPSYFVEEAGSATREEMARALELADVLIPCKSAARELIGSDDIVGGAHRLLEYGPKVVAVTLGKDGCIVLDRNNRFELPAYQVKVVDTTGAGDAFHGGFIFSLLRGYDLEKAGRFSNACGSIACTRVGARASGRLAEVEELLSRAETVT
jgi:sugar/nucleoside kinase (ribokinase family)